LLESNGAEVRVLFLTNNPNLGSTARILQCWLQIGPAAGLAGHVLLQRTGPFHDWLMARSIPCLVDPMPVPNRRWPFPALWHAWKVARWARQKGIDVLHCNEHDVYPFALLLRRLLRRPLVCHVRFAISRAFCEWAFGRPSRQPDALLWTSRQQSEDCASAVAGLVPVERQHLVPLGLDLNSYGTLAGDRAQTRQRWGLRDEDIVVGTASALRPIKHIEDFVTLVERLAVEEPRVVGLIAGDVMPGDEAYGETIRKQVEATGLGPRLRLLGHLEPIEPFHHAIDVFVSTSAYETFGNSVCEAMACRRPVAGYRGGSVHEVVGDAGLITNTGDLEGLTQAVAELVRREDLRAELGQRARARVEEKFNPAQTIRQVIQIHESLLARR
jgi:glycosyltransferase involved in cell wall biosynthesis